MLLSTRDHIAGLDLYDQKEQHRIFLGVEANGSTGLCLFDENGARRAVLGAIELPKTASRPAEHRPEGSLVFEGPNDAVLWKAP